MFLVRYALLVLCICFPAMADAQTLYTNAVIPTSLTDLGLEG